MKQILVDSLNSSHKIHTYTYLEFSHHCEPSLLYHYCAHEHILACCLLLYIGNLNGSQLGKNVDGSLSPVAYITLER